ncbi:MAG: alpha/beta hydrolase, partial [Acidobacteriaceae bacterium]
MTKAPSLFALILCGFLLVSPLSQAQTSSALAWSEVVGNRYIVNPDQQYGFQNTIPLKPDIWEPNGNEKPLPTVIYIHGAGSFFGDRTGAMPQLLPYFVRGWNVVNV